MQTKLRIGLAVFMASLVFSLIAVVQAQVAPTVSIAATDATASEAAANIGVFTVTRTGDTGDSLTVTYSVSGTATELVKKSRFFLGCARIGQISKRGGVP